MADAMLSGFLRDGASLATVVVFANEVTPPAAYKGGLLRDATGALVVVPAGETP